MDAHPLAGRGARRRFGRATCELDGDDLLRLPAGIDLIEVGANRRGDRIDETAQDAVLIQAVDVGEGRLDPAGDLTLTRLALLGRDIEARIEAGGEQVHEIGGDRRPLYPRAPPVTLRIH